MFVCVCVCVCQFVESTRNFARGAPVQSARGQACQHNCPEFFEPVPEIHRKFEMHEDPRVKHLSTERTRGEWWWWWWWRGLLFFPYWRLCNDIYVTFTYDAWGQNNRAWYNSGHRSSIWGENGGEGPSGVTLLLKSTQ